MSEGSRTGAGLVLSSCEQESSCNVDCEDEVVMGGSVGDSGVGISRHCALGGGLSEVEGGV